LPVKKDKRLRKLDHPTWHYILEAAREFAGKPFTIAQITEKVQEKAPRAKTHTIILNLYGMTPNHPSSKNTPSLLKKHAVFDFLGNEKFQLLEKGRLFILLAEEAKEILKTKRKNSTKLKALCRLLKDNVSYYDWVGFYVVDKEKSDELVLGPFVGEPTEHVRIPFGKGICGQAASLKKTFVVQDVSKESNYLACSSKVKSEIVVPVFKENQVAGELDIDSHAASPFTKEDEVMLSRIAEMASTLL
jgi:putative methionine-R-sulfoxide reductase with GAF domain